MPSAPPTPSRTARRAIPRLRRRVATAAAAVALAVVAFLPGDAVFGDSAPSASHTVAPASHTVAPATLPVR